MDALKTNVDALHALIQAKDQKKYRLGDAIDAHLKEQQDEKILSNHENGDRHVQTSRASGTSETREASFTLRWDDIDAAKTNVHSIGDKNVLRADARGREKLERFSQFEL